MKSRRTYAAVGVGILALVVLTLAAVPYLFEDRIAARAQAGISRSIDADVRWGDVGLSLFRDFPNATLRLDDLVVTGRDRFAGDTLAHVASFDLVIGLPSIVRSIRGSGPLAIRSVDVEEPTVHLRVLEDGLANWDLFSAWSDASAAASSSSRIALALRSLEVRDGTLTVVDDQSGMSLAMTGIQQSLSGDFTEARVRATSRTRATALSASIAGVPYLHDAEIDVDAAVDVDTEAGSVAIDSASVRLNELPLALNGSLGIGDDVLALDLEFDSPGSTFRQILSLLPMLNDQPEFATLDASGTVAVSGHVRGDYGETAFPAFEVIARVRDGRFQYADLPLPARDVFLDLAIMNPGGDPDLTVASVDRFSIVIGDDPITGSFVMRTPVSDPELAFQVEGRLDLAALDRTVEIAGADELTGVVATDVSASGRRSALDAERYDLIDATGRIEASQIVVRMDSLPHAVAIAEAVLLVSPSHAAIETFRGRVGSSDVALTGRLDNLFGYAFRDEALEGTASLASPRFDLDEWRSDDELEAIIVPARLELALDAAIDTLIFAELPLYDARGSLRIAGQRATIDGFDVRMFGGTLAVQGFYESTSPARPTFDVALDIESIDVAGAAAAMGVLRTLAPVTRYAEGRMSTELRLTGAVGDDMAPVYEALAGEGLFETDGLSLQGFPALAFLADRLRTEQLRNPGFIDVRSSFRIEDGRLHVSPFDVGLGPFAATVFGSHGFDETMSYSISLELPRALLGAEADRAIGALATQAGRLGMDWQASEAISVGARLGGTVRQPTVALDLQESAGVALQDVETALRNEIDQRQAAAMERADSAVDEARLRAAQEAGRLLEEAEEQAARIGAEADSAAERVRSEGYAQADALVARASSPAAGIAARAAAERVRREADAAADRIRAEAAARATALVDEARSRASGTTGSDTIRSPINDTTAVGVADDRKVR